MDGTGLRGLAPAILDCIFNNVRRKNEMRNINYTRLPRTSAPGPVGDFFVTSHDQNRITGRILQV